MLNRNSMTKASDFFSLYFTNKLIETISKHTNSFALTVIDKKQYYAYEDCTWKETTPDAIKKLIALFLYQGLVKVSMYERCWSTASLYHGLWARKFDTLWDTFKAIIGMLYTDDPATENNKDILRKLTPFISYFKAKCQSLYQPYQNVAVDEQLVKSKHSLGIRQHIAYKPVKFGVKLWVLADSKNGYTFDFEIYIGKTGQTYEDGLGYDVVMKLTTFDQSRLHFL